MIFILVVFLFILWTNTRKAEKHIFKSSTILLSKHQMIQMTIVISDVGIKNQAATTIAHIYVHDNPVIKSLHHAVNVTFTEAELFAIRYGINQATQLANINCIVVIIDLLHAAK